MSRFMYIHYDHVSCNSSELASGIVSTALQCRTGRCPTDDLMLSSPVLVSIQHSDMIKVSELNIKVTS